MIYENKTKTSLNLLSLIACLVMTSGCVIQHNKEPNAPECSNGICTSNQQYTAVCHETTAGYSVCNEAPQGVNYTRTAADFREYGERTPRDYRVTQAGAGNNMSAVVRPSIENEVTDYEAQVIAQQQQMPQGQIPQAQMPQGQMPQATPMTSAQQQQIPQGQAPQASAMTPAQQQAMALNPNQYHVPENYRQQENVSDNGQKELTKDWLAEEGQSLKDLLTAWSEESGWRLIWKTNRNYTLNAGAMFRGNFADVASALVRAFARARPAPIATFYKGNRVLVIETMEDENAYD